MSVPPVGNALSLVVRDPNTLRFTKYISASAPSARYDIYALFELQNYEDEGGDDEDEEEEDEEDEDEEDDDDEDEEDDDDEDEEDEEDDGEEDEEEGEESVDSQASDFSIDSEL